MPTAITRQVSPRFPECELTFIDRSPIDLQRAKIQHAQYCASLKELGCNVIELPAEADLPDSVFVEDTAVVLTECAIVTRPGAITRRGEVTAIATALAHLRKIVYIQPPGTLDGGDVLQTGKKIFIGLSSRTNRQAIDQVKALLSREDYQIEPVEFHDCLPLKTAVSRLDDQTLLINPDWVETGIFKTHKLIVIDRNDPFAANCLPLENTILFPASYPKTADIIRSNGYQVKELAFSEFAKAEGGLTCCSLIVE